MPILKKLMFVLLFLLIGVPVVIWISSFASMDRELTFTQSVSKLPDFGWTTGNAVTISNIQANGMAFRIRAAGGGGSQGNVILLHGFPESSVMWKPIMPKLANAGFQTLAFDQRGYSPGARPEGAGSYTVDQLIADVIAVADAAGLDRFHLVGHDWGAGVGWGLVLSKNPRVISWTALSIPHMAAFAEAIQSDPDQQSKSAYMGFFRTPVVPETLFTFNGLAMLDGLYSDHLPETKAEYLAMFAEPGALTAALNWYRASGAIDGSAPDDASVKVPTLFIWGNQDPAVGVHSVTAQRKYFSNNLTEIELDTGHWIMETHADTVGAAVLLHIMSHP